MFGSHEFGQTETIQWFEKASFIFFFCRANILPFKMDKRIIKYSWKWSQPISNVVCVWATRLGVMVARCQCMYYVLELYFIKIHMRWCWTEYRQVQQVPECVCESANEGIHTSCSVRRSAFNNRTDSDAMALTKCEVSIEWERVRPSEQKKNLLFPLKFFFSQPNELCSLWPLRAAHSQTARQIIRLLLQEQKKKTHTEPVTSSRKTLVLLFFSSLFFILSFDF